MGESLVYLSSDSGNILETLEHGKNYIIGGRVDHNNHKGICFRKAEELGIVHARLPIDQYLEMKTRHVLAINHVYEIMAQFTESGSWKEAFLSTIPNRKGAIEKEDDDKDSKSEDSSKALASEEAKSDDVCQHKVSDKESMVQNGAVQETAP